MKITNCQYSIDQNDSKTIRSINALGLERSAVAKLFNGSSSVMYRHIVDAIHGMPEIESQNTTVVVEEGMFGDARLKISSRNELHYLSPKIESAMARIFAKCVEMEELKVDLRTSIPYISAKIIGESDSMFEKLANNEAIQSVPGVVSMEAENGIIKVSVMPSFIQSGSDLSTEESLRKTLEAVMLRM